MDAVRTGLRTWRSVGVAAATGTGKGTLIAGHAEASFRRGNRVLILTHRDELVEDLAARLRKVHQGWSIGVVKAARDEWANKIVLASVQSVTARRRDRMGTFDLVLTDECHHATAPGYRAIYDQIGSVNPAWRHIGFTATPFRSCDDGGTTGLGDVLDAVVYEYGIGDAIAAGDLVPLRALRVETRLDLTGLKTIGGDYEEGALARLVDVPARNELVVDAYQEHGPGRPALVFAASIAHAQHLAEAFAARGIRAGAVWGAMGDDRARLIGAFQRGELPVLCSCSLIFEGFDAPRTELVLKARPTKSRVVFTQMVGRGLRLSPGKSECIFVDLVDNGVTLDLATAVNLSRSGDPADKEARELVEGDRVRRRQHREWGIGIVLGVEDEVVTVEWPPSDVHADGLTRLHPALELVYVAPVDLDDDPTQLQITPGVDHVRTYEVELLPGESTRSGIGWYRHLEWRVAGGRLPNGDALSVAVRGSGSAWEAWEVRGDGSTLGAATIRLQGAKSDIAARRWGDEFLRAAGARVEAPAAAWKTERSTGKQRDALKRWGIRRDTSEMSRGEAAALLDAVMAVEAIREALDPGRAEREKARKAQFVQWKLRGHARKRAAGGAR
jgi:superfamily II DNA or RNA helicase